MTTLSGRTSDVLLLGKEKLAALCHTAAVILVAEHCM